MGQRQDLQDLLKEVSGTDNVYFQPPPALVMVYPCVRYQIDYAKTTHANNLPYKYDKRYLVTAIVKEADSDIPDRIATLPMCTFNRYYAADQLHHHVFELYF